MQVVLPQSVARPCCCLDVAVSPGCRCSKARFTPCGSIALRHSCLLPARPFSSHRDVWAVAAAPLLARSGSQAAMGSFSSSWGLHHCLCGCCCCTWAVAAPSALASFGSSWALWGCLRCCCRLIWAGTVAPATGSTRTRTCFTSSSRLLCGTGCWCCSRRSSASGCLLVAGRPCCWGGSLGSSCRAGCERPWLARCGPGHPGLHQQIRGYLHSHSTSDMQLGAVLPTLLD